MDQTQRNKKAEQLRLAARIIETGCGWEARGSAEWFSPLATSPVHAIQNGWELRIKEPVTPVPEGWRELRDDEKTGDFIQGARYLSMGSKEWCSLTSGCYAYKPQRIIVPVTKPKKRVPLGPEDVVSGSALRPIVRPDSARDCWAAVISTGEVGVQAVRRGDIEGYSYHDLMTDFEIKRPTDTDWQPAWKLEDEA